MPKVLSYTPAWLSRPSPGFQLVNTAPLVQESRFGKGIDQSDQDEYVGPNRTIARRNTQIFLVVGKQIRWADLPSLKDHWQALQETPSKLPKTKLKRNGSHGQPQSEETVPENGSYRVWDEVFDRVMYLIGRYRS